jgi:small-conductance mechanosensitive channel/CRP-like cAMP-binding protein
MSHILDNQDTLWALVLIIALPLLIIAAGELQERLRQRDSRLAGAVTTLRNWVLPLLAVWALIVLVFDVEQSDLLARASATALLAAVLVALLQVVRSLVVAVREQGREPGRRRPPPELLLMVPRLLVGLIAGWILFVGVWDVDLSGLFAALGVTSIVISIALQDTLSGLASGFMLLADRPFNPGDWVKFGDTEGRVVDVNWRSSRIQSRNGDLIVVPNGVLAGETVINFDQPSRLHRVVVPLQVAYSNPPSRAKDMLLAAAEATQGVLSDPSPQVYVVQVDDPLMGYEARLWVDDYTIAPRVASDFSSLVWYQSHRMGVPLPSPAFDLYHHDPLQEAADARLTTSQLVERIRRSPLLSELRDTDLERLATSARLVRFSRGEAILAPGVISRDFHVLWEGKARVTVDGLPVDMSDLDDGEVFGLSRQAGLHRPPAIMAVTDCEVIIIDAEAAGAVISRNPELAETMTQLQAARDRRIERTRARRPSPEALPSRVVDAGEGEDDERLGNGNGA